MDERLMVMGLLLAAGLAGGYELAGTVRFEDEPHVRPGARAILLARRDTAYTDSLGNFRFERPIGLAKPPRSGAAGEFQVRLRAGFLEYSARDRSEAIVDGFGADGRRWAVLRHQPTAPGPQRVDLGPMLGEASGLGWLRIRSGGNTERLRIVRMGRGLRAIEAGDGQSSGAPASEALGSAAPAFGTRTSAAPAMAKRAEDPGDNQVVDTLRVESDGYYPVKWSVYQSAPFSGAYSAYLWKNSIYGMDPAEVQAWKEFLQRPAVTINISPSRISLPGYVITADGKHWTDWTADRCHPYPLPVKVVLAYSRQGRDYLDTLDLEGLKRFSSSFQIDTVPIDSLRSRFRMSWDWSKIPSILPDRDWMALSLNSTFSSDVDVSYPDVFQLGVQIGIEGGRTLYRKFDPRAGAWAMEGYAKAKPGFQASFTLARREDHDLRVVLSETRPVDPYPTEYALAGDWPADGVLQVGQKIRLSASAVPPRVNGYLTLLTAGYTRDILKENWDGSPLDWSFPYPLRDTLPFRFLLENEVWAGGCGGADTSLELRIAPKPGDSAVFAFEPNDTEQDAALVTEGEWKEAAWDFHPGLARDQDYYRFRAPAGRSVRVGLRNPNDQSISLSVPATTWYIEAKPGKEASRTYVIPASGELLFYVSTADPGGRYSFRIDSVP